MVCTVDEKESKQKNVSSRFTMFCRGGIAAISSSSNA